MAKAIEGEKALRNNSVHRHSGLQQPECGALIIHGNHVSMNVPQLVGEAAGFNGAISVAVRWGFWIDVLGGNVVGMALSRIQNTASSSPQLILRSARCGTKNLPFSGCLQWS